jgi:hypothetical protein
MTDGVPAITRFDVNEQINESSGDNVDAQPWRCARQANDLGCADMPMENLAARNVEPELGVGDNVNVEVSGGDTEPENCRSQPILQSETRHGTQIGKYLPPPSVEQIRSALDDLKNILQPRRRNRIGYKDPEFDALFRGRLEGMRQFMWAYVNPDSSTHGCWGASSLRVASDREAGSSHACKLREWTRAFVDDRENLLVNPYGKWNESILDKDPALAQEIHLHLQSIGQYVKAMDLVNFMDTPDMRARTNQKKRMGLSTAQNWMKKLDY